MSIQVQGLNKHFNQYAALADINLDFHDGELVALLGPSGCGKTTLLRIIAGLEQADAGHVIIRGEHATDLDVRERNVGFVFQHYALFRHMTVFENVAFGLRVKPRSERPTEAVIRARVKELLDLVQLSHVADRHPTQLSGGQRQRVALARALAVQPKVLLLDEPFGALDAQVRKELRRWLRELHDELHVTSLFVTHDQEEALEVADRVVLMNAGRVEQIGTPAEVYDQPASAFVHSFLGSVNLFRGRVAGQGLGIGEQWLGGAYQFPSGGGQCSHRLCASPRAGDSACGCKRGDPRHHHPTAAHGAPYPGGVAWHWGYKRCTLRGRIEQRGGQGICPGAGGAAGGQAGPALSGLPDLMARVCVQARATRRHPCQPIGSGRDPLIAITVSGLQSGTGSGWQ